MGGVRVVPEVMLSLYFKNMPGLPLVITCDFRKHLPGVLTPPRFLVMNANACAQQRITDQPVAINACKVALLGCELAFRLDDTLMMRGLPKGFVASMPQ